MPARVAYPLGRIDGMIHRSGHEPAEEDAIRAVASRLTRQFPELPPDEVRRAVYGKYQQLDDSPVRDFVPVLVEQGVRRKLAYRGPGRRRG
jgi:hypothetical protein